MHLHLQSAASRQYASRRSVSRRSWPDLHARATPRWLLNLVLILGLIAGTAHAWATMPAGIVAGSGLPRPVVDHPLVMPPASGAGAAARESIAAPARVAGVGRLQGLVFKAAGRAVSGMPDTTPAQFVPARILVAQQAGTADATFQQVLTAAGARSLGRVTGIDVHVVEVAAGAEQSTVAALTGNPYVRFAERDHLTAPAATANDPLFVRQWHLAKINVPTAWNFSTGAGITIAILDTGVDGAHPDLSAKMVPGWNFFDSNSNTSDVLGHGTAIAGVAAGATNNGVGIAGVASAARVMPIRITDAAGRARWSLAAQGLIWAADQGARVANISFQGMAASHTLQTALAYFRARGGVVIAAAGNTGAADNLAVADGMLMVSATDDKDLVTSWSTSGSVIDLAAPGTDVYSTAKGGGYGSWSGTSISASIVAGTAALVLSRRPDLTPAQVESALLTSATDLGAAGYDLDYGYGRVNAAAAVDTATGLPAVPACTRANPGLTITPSQSAAVRAGVMVAYTVTLTNNDTAGCGASVFDYARSVPAGWSTNTLAPVSVAPGASASATLQVTAPVGVPNSSSVITATATNQAAETYSRLASATHVIVNTVPGAPVIGTATAGNAQATVTFTAPASNGGSPITSYTVTSSPGNLTASGTVSPLTVSGLVNGTGYTFTVRAVNGIGTGAASAASNSVTPSAPATVPGAPVIGTATAGNAQATVTFTPPASNGGSAITSYTVTANPGGRTASGTGSPLTVTGLTNGTAYTFSVRATNVAGMGGASAASNSVTPSAGTSTLLWSANHESGNFSEWSADGGGMAQGFLNYNPDTSGTVKVEVSSAQAQSGARSARLEMPQGTGNQAQLIRWRESQTNADLYYSVWLYFPTNIDTRGGGWFNLLQIHTHGGGGWTIPIGIEVRTQSNGVNAFFLHSPYSTTSAWNTGGMPYWEYSSTVPIPIGRWFNVELRFKRDTAAGVVQFWQEGVQIFNVQNVQTTHPGSTYHEFYVNIYGSGISPSPTVIYVDNVAISRTRIGATAALNAPGAAVIDTAAANTPETFAAALLYAANGGQVVMALP